MEYLLVAWWLLAFAALAALAYPICARLFPTFPGHGVGFAPLVALLVLSVVAYWTGRVSFGRHTLWVGLLALAGLSVAVGLDRGALREGRVELAGGTDVAPRRDLFAPALVFLVAFLLLASVRAADPAVTPLGGEKFLDYGLLRATLRAETLPVYDFWFAGEAVNYYYGGHLAAALLTFLTATPPHYAYNLALAGFYACLVAGAFDLARAVAAGRARDRGVTADAAAEYGLYAGLAAAFFVGLASNVVTAGRLLVSVLPGGLAGRVAERIAGTSGVAPDDLLAGVDGFSYWTASRVIPGTINEFPFFGFLNGDLHAHMMGAPFLLLAAALAFAYWETPAGALRRRRLLVFGAFPVLGGMQIVTHTWDFPTVFGVLWLALAFAPASPVTLVPGGRDAAERLRMAAGDGLAATEIEHTGGAFAVAAVAGAVGFLLGSPFFLGAATTQELALLDAADRTALGPFLLVHGAFLLAFGAYLVGRLSGDCSIGSLVALTIAGGVLLVAGLFAGVPAAGIVAGLLALGWVALRLDEGVGYETALVIGGAGLVGITELVFVSELAGPGRLNTVFKVYFQVWLLWGVAMGVVLPELWRHGLAGVRGRLSAAGENVGAVDSAGPVDSAGAVRSRLPAGRTVARAVVVVCVLATAPYAGLALADHFEHNDAGTLHATAFVDAEYPGEASAIAWLDGNADHTDTLLEAPGASHSPEGLAADPSHPGMYDWRANPASSLTGVPTVAGWAHQVGYRGPDPYYDRVADVDRAYAGDPDERAAVLDVYDVDYVWVGPTERERYGDVSFEELDGVEVAYETELVTIYRVE